MATRANTVSIMRTCTLVVVHVVLVAPEIAPNTGNIIRLCANTGVDLHLVEPLGFDLDDRLLRRAGLDYHEFASVTVHDSLDDLPSAVTGEWYAFSSGGHRRYTDVAFGPGDALVFGAERNGLSAADLSRFDDRHVLTIPMAPDNRSLNVANAAAVVVYEAWRQLGFDGAAERATLGLTSETPSSRPFDS